MVPNLYEFGFVTNSNRATPQACDIGEVYLALNAAAILNPATELILLAPLQKQRLIFAAEA